MVKAIIFDFFDVLASDGERQFFEKYPPKNSLQTQQIDDVVDAFMQGDIAYDIYRQKLAQIMGVQLSEVEKWLDDNKPNEDLLRFIRNELKGKYKLGIISNSGDDWIEEILGKESTSLFDQITLSFEVGYMKPEPEIYKLTADALGVGTAECLYIDDKEKYCEAAVNVGMQTILFKNSTQCINDLHNKLTFDFRGQTD